MRAKLESGASFSFVWLTILIIYGTMGWMMLVLIIDSIDTAFKLVTSLHS